MTRYHKLACLALLPLVLFLVACSQQEESSGGSASSPPSTSSNHGQEIFNSVCHSCHSTGLAGVPKLGDHSAWNDRIAKGIDSAINGKGKMPPKGGERTLNEKDIRAAVTYMVNQSR